jgi:hypothetical protein
VADATAPVGHPGRLAGVDNGVSTLQHINDQNPPQPRRPFRCLRHHVWMAACDDCRKEHATQTGRQQRTTAVR